MKKETEIVNNAICPACGVEVEEYKCRLCGARLTINSVSGNAIWMRNGRLVSAFADEKKAYVEMAKRYGIPEKRWPEQFRSGFKEPKTSSQSD
jgi:hypothetical protein